MIRVEIDQAALQQVQQRLSSLAPRMILQVQQALRPLLYQALRSNVQKYFAGPAAKGGSTGKILTSRSGDLLNSVLKSLQVTADGSALKVSIGSDLRYAAIHEYGGFAGRRGPFKKKNGRRPYIPPRPYLRPTLNDLEQILPDLLEEAIQQADRSSL